MFKIQSIGGKMSETKLAHVNCPLCGCPVKVVSDPDGEGTNHYEPIQDEKLKQAMRELIELIEEIDRLSNPLDEVSMLAELDRFRKLVE
jgi:uncharacterized Zn finger protein (UPF0148 family)